MNTMNGRVASTACQLLGHKDMFELAREVIVKGLEKRGRPRMARQVLEAFEKEALRRVEESRRLQKK